jgi:hypothetical protein
MADLIDVNRIKIVSITAPDKPPYGMSGRGEHWAKVVFQIGGFGVEYPVYVSRDVADDSIIRMARHYLHMQAVELAESTASWKLSENEIEGLLPQKKAPNKGPGQQIPG